MLVDKGVLEPPMEVPRLFRFGLDYPVWNNFFAAISKPSIKGRKAKPFSPTHDISPSLNDGNGP